MNGKRPKVSVIVAVYKVESFIRNCVDSVLSQTLQDFELLLVDDGSPDNSGVICDEYARKDSRVHVFHKENGGVASARQMGMDNAQGDYIIHADPDDWVEPNMLEELYNEAVEKDADIVICDYWVNNERIVKQQPSALDHLTILQELFQQLYGSCWNKLLKRSFYESSHVEFYKELSYCEDLTFWVRLFQYPVKVAYLPKAYYHYVQHSESMCKTHVNYEKDRDWNLIRILKRDLRNYHKVRKMALTRLSYFIVTDAFQFGNFSTVSFTKRYSKYVPFLLTYKNIPLSQRLLLARICLGMYGYYKKRINFH